MNKLKKDNVLNFPSKMTEIEREVEAIVFAAAEPLSIETVSYTHLTLPTIVSV